MWGFLNKWINFPYETIKIAWYLRLRRQKYHFIDLESKECLIKALLHLTCLSAFLILYIELLMYFLFSMALPYPAIFFQIAFEFGFLLVLFPLFLSSKIIYRAYGEKIDSKVLMSAIIYINISKRLIPLSPGPHHVVTGDPRWRRT